MEKYGQQIESLELVPTGGGRFEVEVDGDLVYSKQQTGRHANPGEVIENIEARG